jgi:DtxR family Mn-dependent transcriptional regulator
MARRSRSARAADLEGGEPRLTAGREAALHVIRAHRLWERHLADDTGFAEAEWHQLAEHYEHELTPGQADELAARLGHPTHDPHGDPIPTPGGELIGHGGRPLALLSIAEVARIVHIEDEPETVYAQLVAEGLYPGQWVRLLEVTPQRVRFWANGNEHVVAPIVAANIWPCRRAGSGSGADTDEPLHHLKINERNRRRHFVTLPRHERRRLLDRASALWCAEVVSPGGDPIVSRSRRADRATP